MLASLTTTLDCGLLLKTSCPTHISSHTLTPTERDNPESPCDLLPHAALTPSGAGIAPCPTTGGTCPIGSPYIYTNCVPPCPANGQYYYCQAANGGNVNGCKPYSTGPWLAGAGVTQCLQQCLFTGAADKRRVFRS